MGPSFLDFLRLAVATVLFESTSVRSENTISLRGLQEDSIPEKRPRIIGGEQANPGRYPYYSLLSGTSLCGAALISPRFVLTAAHCQDADIKFSIGPELINGGVTMQIADRAVHPLYNEYTYENDLAIFELTEDAVIQSADGGVVPAPYVRLSPDEIFSINTNFTVVGFGDVIQEESDTQFSDTLQQTTVSYVSNTECRRDHRGEIQETMMCAKARGQDACYGDSGGPLLQTPTNDYNDDRMVGIVSWGRGCANTLYPGVYTRISSFYDWIVGTMCVLNAAKVPPYVDCAEIMGFAPSDAPGDGDEGDIREEDIPTSEAPTARPTPQPTESPTTPPTVAPTALPTANPTESPVASCGQKGESCGEHNDCCGNRCNFFTKTCSTPVAQSRDRLSSGRGGSAGGSFVRGRNTPTDTTERAKLRTRFVFDNFP
mmetsp:Transcript_11202/g.26933  ORF Transcript_11202/g.26933 Transcript_11202/m.26933 type:complete len:430 (-) Transcript_11202:269-1558(-)|eukprot:CAMPEP_0197183056 /NCGR_PEP_ID=MMETSP1423-20130617/7353_1 /TAXON_ID=476441 /ORGANISM="Pseudo-nitzschia heimii, Strain UNC1101" /LENGTH=429 /DNA_ID=CAMNT_0042633591 /DNA_START=165 /DNA_END=1454 /DNA_ORIENTATION=-